MKKFLSIISISLLCLSAAAQTATPVQQMKGSVRGIKGDTITNTGTVYDSIILNLPYRCGGIEVQCTKISGTLGGQLTLQASIKQNGTIATSWLTLQDSVTVTNTSGAKSYFFPLPGVQRLANDAKFTEPTPPLIPYYIYRILWTGTGTMSGSMKSYAVLRQ